MTGVILLVGLVAAPLMWMHVRRQQGLPALASVDRRRSRESRQQMADKEADLTGWPDGASAGGRAV
jgi:hypothetical protein